VPGRIDESQLLSNPAAPSARQRALGSLASARRAGGPRGASNTPRGTQPHDLLAGVAAPRQFGGNAFDKTVHLAAIVFGMNEH
jgi:hypothetical protein